MSDNKCPLCEDGNTSSREVDGVRFKECNYCGSEFTDAEDMLYNKETYKKDEDKFTTVGEIGNYHGNLIVSSNNGVYQWTIEDWNGCRWEDIPKYLYDALIKFEEERRNG